MINGTLFKTLLQDAKEASVSTTAEHAMHVTFARTCVLNLNTTLGGSRAAKLKHFSTFVRPKGACRRSQSGLHQPLARMALRCMTPVPTTPSTQATKPAERDSRCASGLARGAYRDPLKIGALSDVQCVLLCSHTHFEIWTW